MIRLPHTLELLDVARNTVWFEPPEQALQNPLRLVAHVLTFGSYEDVTILRKYLSDDDLREALENAPAGIFDPRSWAYWHLRLGRHPAPPLPERTFSED